MSMSKKDFIALADNLRHTVNEYSTDRSTTEILHRLCEFMKQNNPNFKEDRWRNYLAGNCGPNGGSLK